MAALRSSGRIRQEVLEHGAQPACHLKLLDSEPPDLVDGQADMVLPARPGDREAHAALRIAMPADVEPPQAELRQELVELVDGHDRRGGIIDRRRERLEGEVDQDAERKGRVLVHRPLVRQDHRAEQALLAHGGGGLEELEQRSATAHEVARGGDEHDEGVGAASFGNQAGHVERHERAGRTGVAQGPRRLGQPSGVGSHSATLPCPEWLRVDPVEGLASQPAGTSGDDHGPQGDPEMTDEDHVGGQAHRRQNRREDHPELGDERLRGAGEDDHRVDERRDEEAERDPVQGVAEAHPDRSGCELGAGELDHDQKHGEGRAEEGQRGGDDGGDQRGGRGGVVVEEKPPPPAIQTPDDHPQKQPAEAEGTRDRPQGGAEMLAQAEPRAPGHHGWRWQMAALEARSTPGV